MNTEVHLACAESEVDAAYELASRIFGPNYFEAQEVKLTVRRLEPLKDLADVIIATVGSAVIGVVRIVNKDIWLGSKSVKVGGITMVCIHPDFRGKGIGIRLMEAAIDRCRRRGDVLSIAFGRRAVDGFYPKLGYVGLGCHPELRVIIDSSNFPPCQQQVHVFPRYDESQLCAYHQAYCDSYRGLVMSFARDIAWWDVAHLRFAMRLHGKGFFTVSNGSEAVGYFIIQEDKQVVEVAAVAGSEGIVATALVDSLKEHGPELRLTLSVGHWAARFFRSFNHTLAVRFSWDGGHLVRIINSTHFAQALKEVVPASAAQTISEVARTDTDMHGRARQGLLQLVDVLSEELFFPAWSPIDEF